MRNKFFLVVALLLLFLWAVPLAAQEGGVFPPSQVAITGQRGQVETRTVVVLLRTQEAVTGLRAIPLDLERTTPGVVLPAERITVVLPAEQIEAGSILTATVTVDMRAVRSGEFSGALLLYHDTDVLRVPLTVTVKDPPYAAFFVLLFGVGIGAAVSNYRAQGRPRDEILAQVGQYRAQMREDEALMNGGKPFYQRIESELKDVDSALKAQDWKAANEALAEVKPIWDRWDKNRDAWIAQLKYYEELHKQVEVHQTTFTKTLLKAAEDLHRTLGAEEPSAFAVKLDGLTEHFNRFAAAQTRVEALAQVDRELALKLQAQLHSLAYDDAAGLQKLETALEAALAQAEADGLEAMPPKGLGVPRGGEVSRGLLDVPILRALMGAPAVPQRTPDEQKALEAEKAASRLLLFKRGTYLLAVLLLAGMGFGELYVNSPAFGANPWGDYFALLAWGFGAEASRSAITDLVKTWGVG